MDKSLIARAVKYLTGFRKVASGHKSDSKELMLGDLDSESAQRGANLFDVTDEKIVSAELSGRMDMARFFVYSFKGSDQKDVVGMGIKGTQALYRKLYKAGPSVAPGSPQYAEDTVRVDGSGITPRDVIRVRCQTVIINPITKEHTPGVSTADNALWVWDREWRNGKSYKTGTGKWIEDKFFYQKALTKATRNAMQNQIDPLLMIDWMFRWLHEKRVLQLETNETKQLAAGGAIGKSRIDMFRARIFSIAEGAGMDMSKADTPDKIALSAWVAKWHKKSIHEITDPDEMMAVSNLLMDTQLHYGPGFAEAIRNGDKPAVPGV